MLLSRLATRSRLVVAPSTLRGGCGALATATRLASSAAGKEKTRFRWKWVPIPIGVGVAFIAFQQFRHSLERERYKAEYGTPPEIKIKSATAQLLCTLPTRFLSWLWGRVHEKELPKFLRKPILGLYVWAFGCDMSEAEEPDLTKYRHLQELFTRNLKPHVRPLADAELVSPADGRIWLTGQLEDDNDTIQQVKGITYSSRAFLGGSLPPIAEGNTIYFCTIYLSPGDCHHFFSPTNWNASLLRHFQGELLPVNTGAMTGIRDLLVLNERVAILGGWKHGFFSFTAIGAYNVGSIDVEAAPGLQTNQQGVYVRGACRQFPLHSSLLGDGCPNRANPYHECTPYCLQRYGEPTIPVQEDFSWQAGQRVGGFQLGSCVVLIFEGPKDLKFAVEPGQKVRIGEVLVAKKGELEK